MKFRIQSKRDFILGLVHVGLGVLTATSRLWMRGNLLVWVGQSLPVWALFLVGAAKGVYGVGTLIPGTTVILFYLLGRPCSLSGDALPVLLAWSGVLSGCAISYLLGVLLDGAVRTGKHWLFQPPKRRAPHPLFALLASTHPNFASIISFEGGYFRHGLARILASLGFWGLLLLCAYTIGLCGFAGFAADKANELGFAWGLGMVVMGAFRIFIGLTRPALASPQPEILTNPRS